MDSIYRLCRLLIGEVDADIEGPPEALDGLAEALENSTGDAAFSVVGGRVGVRRTSGDRLRVALIETTLWIEGDDEARNIVVATMRGVARAAREIGHAPVARHAHIEYLGEDDRWRTADSLPLTVRADWPGPG